MIVGLFGHPVAHSRSPAMHTAAFRAAGLTDWIYELWDTPPDALPMRIRAVCADARVAGFNVTIPHKERALGLLDDITNAARAIGAVNTAFRTGGRWTGDNTDWIGFEADLRAHGVELAKLRRTGALVLGAGGSARAVVYALTRREISVTVINRSPERAQRVATDFDSSRARVTSAALDRLPRLDLPAISLVVNCTSVGMWPDVDASPWPAGVPFPAGAVLYDLVYRPPNTRLMGDASTAGLRAIGGAGMLAEQGAAAFERWTGVGAHRVAGVMRGALTV